MIVTIQKAVELTGKSRSTITRYISTGKLSRSDLGLDTSELLRVFGPFKSEHDTPRPTQLTDSVTTHAPEREAWLMQQIESLQRQLVEQKTEYLERERRLMALLEHQSGIADAPKKSWFDRFK